ncbi:hypothetical protein [Burkholderia pseudomallei]|uniref:hypothetical protein n=2 Tax=Burkholderia pseudomallei TaxID=28450 RepID=UPI0019402765|nr:hypothetical protein [Burkholderia pseudomallei]MBM5616840.1 hypothetical protein [Burkholderia pseudomallei]
MRQVNRERNDMMVCVAELSGPALRRLHAGCDRRRAASVVPGARVTVLSAHRRACRAASDERAGEPREQHAKHVCTSMRRACPRALSQVNAAAPVQGATIGGRRCCGAASHARSLMYVKPARVRVLHIADAGRSRRRGAAAFARPALPASRAGGERAAGSDMRRRALDLPRRPVPFGARDALRTRAPAIERVFGAGRTFAAGRLPFDARETKWRDEIETES